MHGVSRVIANRSLPTGREPGYVQIQRYLLSLASGGDGAQTRLPTEAELQQRFGVSRATVQRAFVELVLRGVVVREPGRGSFLVDGRRPQMRLLPEAEGVDSWSTGGKDSVGSVRELKLEIPPADLASEFGVGPGVQLCYLDRVRYVDGRSFSWDRRWVRTEAWDVLVQSDLRRESLVSALAGTLMAPARGEFVIRAGSASVDESAVLELSQDSPVVRRHLSFSDRSDHMVIVGDSSYASRDVGYRITVHVG